MQAAPSSAIPFPPLPRASMPLAARRARSRARQALAPACSGRAARLLLAVGMAFPLLVGAVAVPWLARLGQAGERVAVVRPASGAPPVGVRVSPLAVSPPPALEPAARASATPPPAAVHPADRPPTYTVQPGDELRHIAAQQGVSIASILALNEVPNPDNLRVGQTLRFPTP